jgi:hypothetical protein
MLQCCVDEETRNGQCFFLKRSSFLREQITGTRLEKKLKNDVASIVFLEFPEKTDL